MSLETTNWFGSTAESSNSRPSAQQFVLSNTTPITPDQSVAVGVVEAVVETLEPQGGQTSLSLYEYVNPDALKEIIDTSATKKSGVEVRFTFEEHLIVVRSNDTVLIYEPLEKQQGETPQLAPNP